MNYILFEDNRLRTNLLPFTFTAPIGEIRVGILTMKERWDKLTNSVSSYLTQDYLSEKFPLKLEPENIFVNSSIVANSQIIDELNKLKLNQELVKDNVIIAYKKSDPFTEMVLETVNYDGEITLIENTWDIFGKNGEILKLDYKLITEGRKSQKLSSTNNLLAEENIFVEEGVKAEFVTINANEGFVYLGKDSELMEGAVIRGPFALCEHAGVKLSAKIYGPTTIGPHSKVGGELNNVVIFGYSNKGHDGFLGNAVLGRWCNLGADTNNSNLKNNYVKVRLWNYGTERFDKTGLQFCGLIMGDHSKSAINTMFNTGTVVGVFANIFGSDFPRNFVPSFSWGGASGFKTYALKKANEVAEVVMARRDIEYTDIDKRIMEKVFEMTSRFRPE